jgi:hypothetical protein
MPRDLKLNCARCNHPILGLTEELSAVFGGGTPSEEATVSHFWCYYAIESLHPRLLALPRQEYRHLLAINPDRAIWFYPVDKEQSGDGVRAVQCADGQPEADG